MKAFVINEDQIKNTVIMLAGALLFVFILGYYIGAQSLLTIGAANHADPHIDSKQDISQLESETEQENIITNPESKKSDKISAETRLQQKKEMAAKKAAEKKEQAKKAAAKKAAAKKESARKEAVKKELARKAAAKKEQARRVAANKEADRKDKARKELARKEAAKKAAKKEAGLAQTNSNNAQSTENPTESAINESQTTPQSDAAGSETKVYSIQAGMFASEANANSFIDKLSAKKFDAYVSSFMSSSGTTKYNVRVGRFAERDQARSLLKEFQKSFSSPAYVVITR